MSQLIRARKAVLSIFLVNGLILGSWIPHIPLVQEKLNIGEGLLGLALLSMAAGAVIFMPISGVWITRLGSRCLLYTSPSPRDLSTSRMPSSA